MNIHSCTLIRKHAHVHVHTPAPSCGLAAAAPLVTLAPEKPSVSVCAQPGPSVSVCALSSSSLTSLLTLTPTQSCTCPTEQMPGSQWVLPDTTLWAADGHQTHQLGACRYREEPNSEFQGHSRARALGKKEPGVAVMAGVGTGHAGHPLFQNLRLSGLGVWSTCLLPPSAHLNPTQGRWG